MTQDSGASADAETGSRASTEPCSTVSALTGFDPARLAEGVAIAAQRFCAELCEDADGVPQPELKALHEALDAFEGYPGSPHLDALYDDSTPTTTVLAALKWIALDPSETDRTRRAASAAIHIIAGGQQ